MNSSNQEKNQQCDRKSLVINHLNRMSPITKNQDYSPQSHIKKVKLQEINSYLTCHLCKGYLIDATTISECLHSFCRSCIIKFLQDNSFCPVCDVIINKAKPNLKLDKTLQDIVYKLVPGLFRSEMMRRRLFYIDRPREAGRASPEQRGEDTERTIFSPKDSISLSLEYIGDAATSKRIIGDLQNNLGLQQQEKTDPKNKTNPEESLLKRYLQCPGMCRIDIIKKFICNKYNVDMDLFQIDVLYKRVPLPLPDHYTLIDVAYIYTWKRNEPMRFYFRIIEKGNDEPPDLTKVFTPSETPPLLRSQALPITTNSPDTPIITEDKDRKKRCQKKNTAMKTLRRRKEKDRNDIITRLNSIENHAETPHKNVEAVADILADELKEQQRKCKRGPLIYDSSSTENRTEMESSPRKDTKKHSKVLEKVPEEKKLADANVFDFVDETLPQYNGNHNSIAQALKREPHYKLNVESTRGGAIKDARNLGDKRETKKNADNIKTLAQLRKTPDREKKSSILLQPRKNQSYLKCTKPESSALRTDAAKNADSKAQSSINAQPKNEEPLMKSTETEHNSKDNKVPSTNEFNKEQSRFLEYFGLSSGKTNDTPIKDKTKTSIPSVTPSEEAIKSTVSPTSGKQSNTKTSPTQTGKVKEANPVKTPSSSAKRKKSSPIKNESKKAKLVKLMLQSKSKEVPKVIENQDQNKLQALFQNCRLNIPSSLSITLKENDEVSRKPGEIPPVQNFIEILKIDEKEGVKTAQREESIKYSLLDAKKAIESPKRLLETNSANAPTVTSSTAPNENPLKTPLAKSSNAALAADSSSKSKEVPSKSQQHSFQKIFEESIKKCEQESGGSPDNSRDCINSSNKRNLMDIARELSKKTKLDSDVSDSAATNAQTDNSFTPPKNTTAPSTPVTLVPKVAIPRINNQRVVKPPKRSQKYDLVPNQTLTNLHSSSLGLNYTVSVGKQSKNPVQQTYKVNGILSPQSCTSNSTNVEANKKSPSPRDKTSTEQARMSTSPKPAYPNNVKSSPVSPKTVDLKIPSGQPKVPKIPHSPKPNIASSVPKTEHGSLPPVNGFSPKNYPQITSQSSPKTKSTSPKIAQSAGSSSISPASSPTLTPNQLLEKYNIQNLAQLSASINFNSGGAPQNFLNGNQMAALQHSMFVKQIEMQNRHKWLNINQGILQFEKYLQSLNVSTNKILGNIKDN